MSDSIHGRAHTADEPAFEASLNGSIPWYVKAIVYLGAPTAIACFLIWFVTSLVSTTLVQMNLKLDQHVSTTNFYLRQVCLNTAQNESQRSGCFQPTNEK